VEIAPGGFLLAQAGESVQLTGTVVGSEGTVLPGPVTWKSLNPAVLTVDASGRATAVAEIGSAQVVAMAQGIESAPILALVAKPVTGAVLVSDAQVVDEPVAVDPVEAFDVGWKYKVALTGVAVPPTGAVLVSRGAAPVGGRVVSAKQNGHLVEVVLQVIPPWEMFEELSISETFDLGNVEPVPTADTSAGLTVERRPGGGWLIRRPLPNGVGKQEISEWIPEWVKGFWKTTKEDVKPNCKADSEFQLLNVEFPAVTVLARPTFHLEYDTLNRVRRRTCGGEIEAEIKISAKVSLGVGNSYTCCVELFAWPIPINGPLALVFGGSVPMGIGVEGTVKGSAGDVIGYEWSIKPKLRFEMGYERPDPGAAVKPVIFRSGSAPAEGRWIHPGSTEPPRVEVGVFPFVFFDLSFGAPFIKKVRFDSLELKMGAKATGDFSLMKLQAAAADYHSTYKTFFYDELETSSKWERVQELAKNMWDVQLPVIDATYEVPYEEFPVGRFTVSPAEIDPGQEATFTVELASAKYGAQPMVESLEIVQRKDDANGFSLETVCSIAPQSADQRTFTCKKGFKERGVLNFYAFVKITNSLGLIQVEVGDDSKVPLSVGTGCVLDNTSWTVSYLDCGTDPYTWGDQAMWFGPGGSWQLFQSPAHDDAGEWVLTGDALRIVSTVDGGGFTGLLSADCRSVMFGRFVRPWFDAGRYYCWTARRQ